MELVGEEKRIRALFSELRLADEQTNTSFAEVWNRAQPQTIRTPGAFKFSFVAATALLVCALVSLGWWLNHRQRNPEVAATAPHGPAIVPVKLAIKNDEVPKRVPQGDSADAKSRVLKLRREALLVAANRKTTREAKTIASWQSPTATLLASQSDQLLKSLPQLNQTVEELNSFLPSQPK